MQIPNKDISRGLRLRLRLADVFKYFRSSTKYKYIHSVFAGLGVEVGVAPCNSEIRNLTSCRKLFIYLAVCQGKLSDLSCQEASTVISSLGFKITIKFLMNFCHPNRDLPPSWYIPFYQIELRSLRLRDKRTSSFWSLTLVTRHLCQLANFRLGGPNWFPPAAVRLLIWTIGASTPH